MTTGSARGASGPRGPAPASATVAFILLLIAVGPTVVLAQDAGNAGAEATGHEKDVSAAAWLAGCWEASSPEGGTTVEEQWTAPRGGLMLGLSRSTRGGETRGYEFLAIREEDGSLVYHAIPSSQSPTDFPARSVEEGRFEFVNEHHDFPRKIVYTRVAEEIVHAAVFAEVDGTEPAFTLPYRRVQCPGR